MLFCPGHLGFKHLHYSLTPDYARQRQRHPELWVIRPDRDYSPFIAEHHLGNARAYDGDPILTSADAFDNRDVRIANFSFDLVNFFALARFR